MDLVINNAKLRHREGLWNIGIKDGRILKYLRNPFSGRKRSMPGAGW